jgi:hypothetical protein
MIVQDAIKNKIKTRNIATRETSPTDKNSHRLRSTGGSPNAIFASSEAIRAGSKEDADRWL